MTKKKKILLCLFLFLCGTLVLSIIYNSGNGLVGDWAQKVFISEIVDEEMSPETVFNWVAFKSFLIMLILLTLCTILIATYLLTSYFSKKSKNRMIQELSSNIELFIKSDITDINFFHQDFSKIAYTLASLKNEQLVQEENLKKENQQKHDLITYLAHDLKTPLASVIGYLSLLQEAPDLPLEQRAKYIGIALDKAYRLEQLTSEFFEISRYSLYTLELNKTTFQLPMLLEQVTEEMFPLLDKKKQKISFIKNVPSGTITGDAEQLSRVFDNLLKNANTYGDKNSTILIELTSSPKTIKVKITNSGSPLSKQQLQRIFQKFYRVDNARSSETGNAGLGLAIAKQIVETHGGKITACSFKNQTTFSVELPLNQ